MWSKISHFNILIATSLNGNYYSKFMWMIRSCQRPWFHRALQQIRHNFFYFWCLIIPRKKTQKKQRKGSLIFCLPSLHILFSFRGCCCSCCTRCCGKICTLFTKRYQQIILIYALFSVSVPYGLITPILPGYIRGMPFVLFPMKLLFFFSRTGW